MMWGDPERAASIEPGSDQLATLLFQISSPAHIPWGDQRWQEVLHGYDVWVHMDDNNPLMDQACQSMAKHAETSSNLAALSLHVTRMMRDLTRDIRTPKLSNNTNANKGINSIPGDEDSLVADALVADFSKRISRIAKARATAGALQLLRLLCHTAIVEASKNPDTAVANTKEVFTYHTRGDLSADQPAGYPLVHSLLDFIAMLGTERKTSTTMPDPAQDILQTPEIYDAAVFSFQLLFVLCGTQLYQPFHSSFESSSSCHYFLEELFRQNNDDNCEDNVADNNNLQILWSSNRSMGSNSTRSIGNGSSSRTKRKTKFKHKRTRSGRRKFWTPKAVLETCLDWQLYRPLAPEHSIAHYYYAMAKSAVGAKGGEKPGQDGLYETHMVVQAVSPNGKSPTSDNNAADNNFDLISTTTSTPTASGSRQTKGGRRTPTKRNNVIVDTTKGILTLGGSIIFLPLRLMSLVYGVFTTGNKKGTNDLNRAIVMKNLASARYSRTRDILWLSDSLLADLGCSLILLLVSNNRNGENSNPFRNKLKNLTDTRWYSENMGIRPNLPDLPNFSEEGNASLALESMEIRDESELQQVLSYNGETPLALNFESLFTSFGRTLHTELGALLLYTILQSSSSFAESLAVRSDMDNLVMPLLRTLYFASRSNTYMAKDYATKHRSSTKNTRKTSSLDIRSCPFRTQSQLYVIIILLLLFSQDVSFGRDIFRRVIILSVPWYKERNLKCINLGSVVILTLLRSLLFNLNRMDDVFLLNNCCAVLENLSPSITDLHEYAAMRLVSVTVNVMKKHAKLGLAASHNNTSAKKDNSDHDGDVADSFLGPLEMHSEVAHTLLGLIKHGLSLKNIEGNIHMIYALVYHQTDLINLSKTNCAVGKKKKKLYASAQTNRIVSVILRASEAIQEEGARTAPKALKVLERQMKSLKTAVMAADGEMMSRSTSNRKQHMNNGSNQNGCGGDHENDVGKENGSASLPIPEEEFTFSYEEEADPEVFFVPYIWDLVVSTVTASIMDWKKDDIEVFELLDIASEEDIMGTEDSPSNFDPSATDGEFSKKADEMV
ncbi:unnamed protein product [Pseudo-nitzschia multistriata]|uniref:Dymeclin n=1 Tax=Pseudo-nitzschia multistriata TaxID=183589 RepID=A0A448YV04_9STRA|nr:unnamed protein product [Pseudo-nitzschia multistriata]